MIHIAHTVLVFSSMRIYAISNRSILLAAIVGILSMVPVVTDSVCLDPESVSARKMADWCDHSGYLQDIRWYHWLPSFEAADMRLV